MSAAGELDEFQLVRPLGRGGMGDVYLGHDTVLDRAVAIKLIGSRNPDTTTRERFLTEARAIARLSHPNVVTIFRVGTTGDGRPFLVQELIRGRSLDQLARPVPWRQLCELAIGIARGLDAAHRRGILHRDVKPANVMLDDRGTARLLDFGLAKLTAAPEPRPIAGARRFARPSPGVVDLSATRDHPRVEADASQADLALCEGSAATPAIAATPEPRVGTSDTLEAEDPSVGLGTPRYMAPELWRGEPATIRSDLYSLGVMLYELATGVVPYPQSELGELERAVLDGGARPIEELAPELPPVVARLITRNLALAPADRPGSAAEVAHELEAVLVDAPAVPEGNPYRGLRPFDAAHRGLFFGRGLDVSVLVDRLRSEALLVVAGDSGIGKSSVCHAGVAPAVLAGALADRRRWRAVSIAPGRRPWDALRDALGIAVTDETDHVAELVRSARPVDGEGVLIVIDQLEELVTMSEPGQAARVAEVIAAICDGVPGIKALLAVRGDFLTRVASLAELGEPIRRGVHLLRVLSPEDLREAIVGPARATGIAFETEEVIARLVEAVAGNPGALPLLQFTLAELWQRREVERGVISARALAELGGVEGGLAGHADAVLFELGAEQRAAARQIVLRLVTDARTRAVRERAELIAEGAASVAALESLVRGRLVVARDALDGSPSYELAHEALIRSWGTLRDWLDAAAGDHAARNRLIASAAEWQRMERRTDLLWSRRQLDDAKQLEGLTSTEHAFVLASRRQLRRRRWTRIAAIAALPVVAIAIWAGVRIDTARQRDRAVAARVMAATAHRERADELARGAAQARELAFARFDSQADDAAEQQWAEARRLAARAHAAYGDAEAELEAAHLVDASVARSEMALVLSSHATLAETERDRTRTDDLLRRLATYEPSAQARWRAPGKLVVELDRAARISVHGLAETGPTIAGGFAAEARVSEVAARLELALAPGSYVIVLEMPDGLIVRDPILIERGQRVARKLAIPAARSIPAGFAFVHAGRFLYGSARDEAVRRDFLYAEPLHEVATDGFLIARTEVTFGEWLAYVRSLSGPERAVRRPAADGVTVEERDNRFVLTLQPTKQPYRAEEGQQLTYPERKIRQAVRWENLPVSGISWEDALAYAAWLDRTGRVPNARPCSDHEWERAARGADGRSFPHGEALAADQANFDLTYGRNPLAFGPDEVGSYPASDSPYGVADMAGNAFELVRSAGGKPWMKGGSWYQGALTALSSNHSASEPTQRAIRVGLRICANAPSAR